MKFRLGRVSELLNLVGRERRFHYMNAVGVLHHLPDPLQGLKTLSRLLTEDGAMSLALYGSVGRTGVYHLRELARLVAASREAHSTDSLATGAVIPTIEDAEAVMKSLPTSSMFAKTRICIVGGRDRIWPLGPCRHDRQSLRHSVQHQGR